MVVPTALARFKIWGLREIIQYVLHLWHLFIIHNLYWIYRVGEISSLSFKFMKVRQLFWSAIIGLRSLVRPAAVQLLYLRQCSFLLVKIAFEEIGFGVAIHFIIKVLVPPFLLGELNQVARWKVMLVHRPTDKSLRTHIATQLPTKFSQELRLIHIDPLRRRQLCVTERPT